jgi:hypothetical protein
MTTIRQARRVAKRAGSRVCKSRDRSQHWNNWGQLQLINDRNFVVLGFNFDASPEEVVEFCRAEMEAANEGRRAAKGPDPRGHGR